MICPLANTMVNAPIPAAHWLAGKLWRTSAVVDATTDRNTAPDNNPDTSTSGHASLIAGNMVATPDKALSSASGRPSLQRSSNQAHNCGDAITATPSSA